MTPDAVLRDLRAKAHDAIPNAIDGWTGDKIRSMHIMEEALSPALVAALVDVALAAGNCWDKTPGMTAALDRLAAVCEGESG